MYNLKSLFIKNNASVYINDNPIPVTTVTQYSQTYNCITGHVQSNIAIQLQDNVSLRFQNCIMFHS